MWFFLFLDGVIILIKNVGYFIDVILGRFNEDDRGGWDFFFV